MAKTELLANPRTDSFDHDRTDSCTVKLIIRGQRPGLMAAIVIFHSAQRANPFADVASGAKRTVGPLGRKHIARNSIPGASLRFAPGWANKGPSAQATSVNGTKTPGDAAAY